MILQWRGCLPVAAAILGMSAACNRAGDGTATSRVMGDIDVAAGQHTGDVSTVNGSIRIRENAVVATAHTVNGSISLDSQATAAELKTVNGSIRLEPRARVSGNVNTVNGRLSLADGAEVGGQLGNVNGPIRVAAAQVGGGVDTVSGGIELGSDAHVDGGIHVRKETGVSFHLFSEGIPHIVVGPRSVVTGALNFERPVKLYVSDQATIGPVLGATVVKFSGERPPD
jgi:cytoskeletal protein CcmA (bactofilin family)